MYLSQTLITLNLKYNGIRDGGAQTIGHALQTNQVRYIFRFYISISHRFYLPQTLTTLDLTYNKIGDRGAEAIGEALQTNRVR